MTTTPIYWTGIDVAKNTFDAALACTGYLHTDKGMEQMPVQTFARTPEGVEQFLAWLERMTPQDEHEEAPIVRAVMEATGTYSLELTIWLLEKRPTLQPAIVNPRYTANYLKSLGLRNKTDRIEARALALYGWDRRPVPHEPMSPEQEQLRALNRYRDTLLHEQVAERNRNGFLSPNKTVRKLAKDRLRQLKRHIEKVEKEMKTLIKESPALKHDYDLLTSIPGVAFITACVVLAELGDLRRFERARQLTAFVGVSPRTYESGSSVRKRTRMCKTGNPRVRKGLYMAALVASRNTKGPLNEMYTRLVQSGKAPMAALGAVMRKLLVLMRALLITDTPYDKNHRHRGIPVENLALVGGKPM